MKTVILAGGLGNPHLGREPSEAQADDRDRRAAILWHIMKLFSHYGFNDFIICLGYKG